MGIIFDPDVLGQVVREHLGPDLDPMFDGITQGLAQRYPGHIHTGPRRWIFNNAGGAMGQMALLHCSLTEYVLLFGSPIGTEGHSGRYATDVYDWTLAGKMWTYVEGDLQRQEYLPGSLAFLGRNQAKGYRAVDALWVLEYSRGPIPSMLPFGLADSLLSTLDLRAVGRTVWSYARMVTAELAKGKL
ncbi:MAG: hypothetical protein H6746_19735 [Deltaproteobacteria bacterium]|nr:hypothetical protein [Deltaproteobacteria bacterium]